MSFAETIYQISAGRFRGLMIEPNFFLSIATSSQTLSRMSVAELRLPFGIAAGNLHDATVVLVAQILVFIH